MILSSLGHLTDLLFHRYDGMVIDRGDYIVATTDTNPNFFWGNLLIYKRPPRKGDLEKWKSDFKREITHPDTYHMTFGWDSPTGAIGEVEEFLQDGFTLEKSIVLTAESVTAPPKFNPDVTVKFVETDGDFEQCIQNQTASGGGNLSKADWEKFYRNQMKRYRNIISSGKGAWFGAHLEGKLVGSLGIFTEGDLGRYQLVSTHPDFQRRGVCGTLVYQSALYALANMGVETLVMVADEEYHAAKIYESVGFKPREKMVGLCKS